MIHKPPLVMHVSSLLITSIKHVHITWTFIFHPICTPLETFVPFMIGLQVLQDINALIFLIFDWISRPASILAVACWIPSWMCQAAALLFTKIFTKTKFLYTTFTSVIQQEPSLGCFGHQCIALEIFKEEGNQEACQEAIPYNFDDRALAFLGWEEMKEQWGYSNCEEIINWYHLCRDFSHS